MNQDTLNEESASEGVVDGFDSNEEVRLCFLGFVDLFLFYFIFLLGLNTSLSLFLPHSLFLAL